MLTAIISAVAFFAATHAGAEAPAPGRGQKTELFRGRKVAAGEVLVKFKESALPQDIERAGADADVEFERKVGGGGVRLLRSRGKAAETLVRELSARHDVVYAEPNYVIRASNAPNDPQFVEQWALQNTGYTTSTGAGTPGSDIGAASAWAVSTGSRDNVVAVVDTGIDYSHPDLAANMWSAPTPFTVEIGGQTIRCEAGTHGFNAVTKTCDPTDEYDHGTHVAGIIGAAGNNGAGGAGVNWTASIMDIKFFDASGNATLADAIDGIEFAIQAKRVFGAGANVRVLSNSWGWNGEAAQSLLDEINRAAENEMLFVAGAGNGGDDRVGDDNDVSPFYPASYDAPNVVAVAATDNKDALAPFSNYSKTRVHLGAPGVLIYSTIMGGRYDWWSGTSMATPHVSGAAALVLSRCTLDTAGLKDALLSSVDYLPSLSGVTATGGRLDVNNAINSCAASAPTPAPSPAPTPSPTPTPNSAPSVALSGPAGGKTFTAPATITIGANASDADGAVSRVDFYAGTRLVGTDHTSPYAVAWENVTAGRYSLTAVATDDRGAATTSAPATVYVNQPPTAQAGGPYAAQAGQAVRFNGLSSSDSDGAISSYLWDFGDGTTGSGDAPAHAYAAAGTYTVTLTVTDDRGASAGSTTTATISASRYSISGRVTDGAGVGLANVSLSLNGSQSATTQTDSAGNYSLTGLVPGGNYSLTPSLPGYTFTPPRRSYTNLGGEQTAQDFTATLTAGLQYYPLAHPVRLLDTRPGQPACSAPGTPLAGKAVRTQAATGTCGGLSIPPTARAVVGNATVVTPSSGGYVTLYPSGAARPTVSNLNYVAGQVVPNAFTVGLGASGSFDIFTPSETHFIVDVAGYYAPPGQGGLYYHPLPYPIRLLDTRVGASACDTPGSPIQAGVPRSETARIACSGVVLPPDALAVVGNATVVNTRADSGAGYATLYAGGTALPAVSNLNYVPGQIVPNAFTLTLGPDGTFNVYASTTLDFIVDVAGYYSASPAPDANGVSGLLFYALPSPVRLLDTRPGEPACSNPGVPLAGNGVRTQAARLDCGAVTVPAAALSVIGNATVVNSLPGGDGGHVTLYPSGAARPNVSNLNYVPGQIVANALNVGIGRDGAFNIYASATTDFIVDVSGYFAP